MDSTGSSYPNTPARASVAAQGGDSGALNRPPATAPSAGSGKDAGQDFAARMGQLGLLSVAQFAAFARARQLARQ